MLSQVEKLLGDDEELRTTINPSRYDSRYLNRFVIAGLIMVLGIVSVLAGWMEVVPFIPLTLLGGLGLVVASAFAFFTELRRRFVMYHVTTRKIIEETGIVDKRTVTVPFDRITNTFIEENLEERLFDVGDIHIATAGTDTPEMVLNGVKLPAEFKVDLEELYIESQEDDSSYTYSAGSG